MDGFAQASPSGTGRWQRFAQELLRRQVVEIQLLPLDVLWSWVEHRRMLPPCGW